ncbi:MAG: flavin reductase [Actinobacteria bacterium]|uniref:Unannotated protein n=1 Tax=freshwater metagenome TaxID=449393 RepID=A0A6J6S904_9ZZZZ|nr:flavin reductase [Actinomycetota bacterium]
MTIHSTHPFADAEPDQVRRLRGRLGGAVSLWTAGTPQDRSGLTVSSLMVGNGPEPVVLGLLDPDADLTDALRATGRGVVQLLGWADRHLADAFAGTVPAPGGPFRLGDFEQTTWGPRLVGSSTWAGVELVEERECGWSTLVTCRLDEVVVGEPGQGLGHHRGRYHVLGG